MKHTITTLLAVGLIAGCTESGTALIEPTGKPFAEPTTAITPSGKLESGTDKTEPLPEPAEGLTEAGKLDSGPAPIEPTGRPFAGPATAKIIGEKVQVKWIGRLSLPNGQEVNESWWLGQIIAVFPENDTVEIHYIGWSAEWNEVVKLNRIRKHP